MTRHVIGSGSSYNFGIAKVLAILLVVSAHFFQESLPLLWIPVTIGLFVFAYSSAYFTTHKYGGVFHWVTFWRSKAGRLSIPFLLSQAFLLLLFVGLGKEGIWTWHTMIHWLGQSGWLNWFGIANTSPFGAGLWFFTLLLIFYLLYPLILKLNEIPLMAHILVLFVLVITLILDKTTPVGHALWLTAFAFWFGVYAACYPVRGSAQSWLFVGIVSSLAMLAANMIGQKSLNPVLLVVIAIAAVQWIEKADIPRTVVFSKLLLVGPVVLEIYLIHTYLFVESPLPPFAGYLVSMALILTAASILHQLAGKAEKSKFFLR